MSAIWAIRTHKTASGEPFLTCVQKTQKGIEFTVYDTNLVPSHTFALNQREDVTSSSFFSSSTSNEIMLKLDTSTSSEVLIFEKSSPHALMSGINLPKSDIRQTRGNQWWDIILAHGDGILSLFWLDRVNKITIRVPAFMKNKAQHVAIMGDSRDTTHCYLTERHTGFRHLVWYSPHGEDDSCESNTMKLSKVDPSDNILLMDSFADRFVLITQDTKGRRSIATVKILIMSHKDKTQKPEILREITLVDYPAPLGVAMSDNGIVILSHRTSVGWFDIMRNSQTGKIDGHIDTKQANVAKISVVKNTDGKTIVAAWIADVTELMLKCVLFNPRGEIINTLRTNLPIELGTEKIIFPRIYNQGNHFYAYMKDKENVASGVSHYHLDI